MGKPCTCATTSTTTTLPPPSGACCYDDGALCEDYLSLSQCLSLSQVKGWYEGQTCNAITCNTTTTTTTTTVPPGSGACCIETFQEVSCGEDCVQFESDYNCYTNDGELISEAACEGYANILRQNDMQATAYYFPFSSECPSWCKSPRYTTSPPTLPPTTTTNSPTTTTSDPSTTSTTTTAGTTTTVAPETGACCYDNGSCEEGRRVDIPCTNGTWYTNKSCQNLRDENSCTTTTAAPVYGACCYRRTIGSSVVRTCEYISQSECTDLSGTFTANERCDSTDGNCYNTGGCGWLEYGDTTIQCLADNVTASECDRIVYDHEIALGQGGYQMWTGRSQVTKDGDGDSDCADLNQFAVVACNYGGTGNNFTNCFHGLPGDCIDEGNLGVNATRFGSTQDTADAVISAAPCASHSQPFRTNNEHLPGGVLHRTRWNAFTNYRP